MTKEHRPALSTVQPNAFVHRENEKTKLNWFCYEISMAFYAEINEQLGKSLKKYRISDKDIADFSIYLSKKIKDVILQKLSGKIDKVYFSYEMIELYFPSLSDRLVDRMLTAISQAWDTLLSVCETCPTRCISEKDVHCTMFDDEFYTRE